VRDKALFASSASGFLWVAHGANDVLVGIDHEFATRHRMGIDRDDPITYSCRRALVAGRTGDSGRTWPAWWRQRMSP
jgi:hypothetical protein